MNKRWFFILGFLIITKILFFPVKAAELEPEDLQDGTIISEENSDTYIIEETETETEIDESMNEDQEEVPKIPDDPIEESSEEPMEEENVQAEHVTAPMSGYYNWEYEELTPLHSAGTDSLNSSCAWKLSPDGETVYIYLHNVVDWSGLQSTGNFNIVTDTGRTFLFRINDGNVYVGNENNILSGVIFMGDKTCGDYEIPIPVASLPFYRETISFGYDSEHLVLTGLKLPKEEESEGSDEVAESNGIVIDGDYSDWTEYPMTRLDYTTSGTQTAIVDGECSLYSDGEYIFGYCTSSYGPHIQNALDVCKIALFNRLPETTSWGLQDFGWNAGDLYFRYAKVDSDGNMKWLSDGDLEAIKSGTTELYIFHTGAWGNSRNINDLTAGDHVYGKLFVTVDSDQAQSEFFVYAKDYAERYGLGIGEIPVATSQYIRIGGYSSTAGTSTLPLLCLGLCCLVFLIDKNNFRGCV